MIFFLNLPTELSLLHLSAQLLKKCLEHNLSKIHGGTNAVICQLELDFSEQRESIIKNLLQENKDNFQFDREPHMVILVVSDIATSLIKNINYLSQFIMSTLMKSKWLNHWLFFMVSIVAETILTESRVSLSRHYLKC